MNKDKYALMNTATKFQTRAYSALLIGEAIKAVHGDPESSECIEAEKLLHDLVRQHAATSQGESYPVCEGVTMALRYALYSLFPLKAKPILTDTAPLYQHTRIGQSALGGLLPPTQSSTSTSNSPTT